MNRCASEDSLRITRSKAQPSELSNSELRIPPRHCITRTEQGERSSGACALLSDSVLRGGDVEQDQFPLHFRVQVAVEHEPAAMLYHQTYD